MVPKVDLIFNDGAYIIVEDTIIGISDKISQDKAKDVPLGFISVITPGTNPELVCYEDIRRIVIHKEKKTGY